MRDHDARTDELYPVNTRYTDTQEMRQDGAQQVAAALQSYVDRHLFRHVEELGRTATRAEYAILWHLGRCFVLVVSFRTGTISFENVLPGLVKGTSMEREFADAIADFHSTARPAHRRVDRQLAVLSCGKGGGISLKLKQDTYDWGLRKLIQVTHELFSEKLTQGAFYQYQLENCGVDPDRISLG